MDIIKISELLKDLAEWRTLFFLVIVGVLGILGSFAKKYATAPEDRKSNIKYILVGVMAAIAILLVITPTSAVMLISVSIVAGYAGSAVLDVIANKLNLTLKLSETIKDLEISKQKEKNNRVRTIQFKNNFKKIAGKFNKMGVELPKVMSFVHPEGETNGIQASVLLKAELYQLERELDSLLTESAVYSKFVIILDEDYKSDKEYYNVVFESSDKEAARSQTQYEKVKVKYPRDVFHTKWIESLKLEHTETGTSKDAAIYELSY